MTDHIAPNKGRYIDLARAQLAQTRANTCHHGISLTRATCRECAKPAEDHDQTEVEIADQEDQ